MTFPALAVSVGSMTDSLTVAARPKTVVVRTITQKY
jgi:hypothetical protein